MVPFWCLTSTGSETRARKARAQISIEGVDEKMFRDLIEGGILFYMLWTVVHTSVHSESGSHNGAAVGVAGARSIVDYRKLSSSMVDRINSALSGENRCRLNPDLR